MVPTPSRLLGSPPPARRQSADGRGWLRVPDGVMTTGRYALILQGLRPSSGETIDLGAYEVGIGPSVGTPLADYLRGRVDKACARLSNERRPSNPLPLVARARLVPPYAGILGP